MSVISYSESGWDTQDDRWDDWEADEMSTPMKCLFCTHTFQSPIILFRHVKQIHGFDFPKTRARLNLDFYQSMRVVNYIRTMGLTDPNFSNVSGFSIDGTEPFINDDAYLRPAIEDDTLLYALDELDLDDTASVTSSRIGSMPRTPRVDGFDSPASLKERELMSRIKTLEHQLGLRDREVKFIAEQFDEYRQMVKRQFYDNIDDGAASVANDKDAAATSSSIGNKEPSSDYYFNSYANNDIHLQMLQDKVRTEGYRDFIYDNKDVFKGKIVLDVGCGTGILSMFAARAGAAKVIAVDNSDIIHKARANVIENKLDGIITLVKGKIEDLELPVDRVDVIISEWMGYFLLFEAMLDSVLVARDRFLAPGGLLAPSASYIYLTAIQDDEYMNDQVNYWDHVYGFKMSAMKTSGPVLEADVDVIPSSSVAATRALIAEIDHGTATAAKLDFASSFAIEATRDARIHAFLGYFDVAFSRDQSSPGPPHEELCLPVYATSTVNSDSDSSKRSDGGDGGDGNISPKSLWKQPEASMNGFTTGPHGTPTHWKQTVFVLKEPVDAKQGDELRGKFTCKKSTTNPRELDLEITYYLVPSDKKSDPEYASQDIRYQKYQLRPTGFLHLGGLRTALFNYLLSRRYGGSFILRIEDTDQKRFVPGATENIIKALEWAGLSIDEGPGKGGPAGTYFQSQRGAEYQRYATELLDKGAAYRCFCTPQRLESLRAEASAQGKTPMYDRHCLHLSQRQTDEKIRTGEPYTIRLLSPNPADSSSSDICSFRDIVHGDMRFQGPAGFDDAVLLKSDGLPTYHLANVVDDHLMGITHVIRGEEWLISTPKHRALFKALGWPIPEYAHLPLLMNIDGTKLSKRNRDGPIQSYIDDGYLPSALINYVALLGWHPSGTQEIFSLSELEEAFTLGGLSRSKSIVTRDRLDWLSRQHLRAEISDPTRADRLAEQALAELKQVPGLHSTAADISSETVKRALGLCSERLTLTRDIFSVAPFLFRDPELDTLAATGFVSKVPEESQVRILQMARQHIDTVASAGGFADDQAASWMGFSKEVAKLAGVPNKQAMMMLRFSLTGQPSGPSIPDLMAFLSTVSLHSRIENAILHFQKHNNI
ncbi:hypothetical protein GGI12_001196 [Dipsacomyces acuminosporus]|nr:hypothetical protein GGI12_001196 [Dipsacomyces acuminosporus]